jgi:hypothetical protein
LTGKMCTDSVPDAACTWEKCTDHSVLVSLLKNLLTQAPHRPLAVTGTCCVALENELR